ncbi:MAG: hypothetical protein JW990_10650 [Thermoleophilia bacterium]|nr:hypothetical protein [Thermoleophilia bacterium]
MKRFGPNFIVNRIQRVIGETAMDMVQEGLVEPEEIDAALKNSLGIRLPIVGVMQTLDFQDLDMLLAYQRNVGKVVEPVSRYLRVRDPGGRERPVGELPDEHDMPAHLVGRGAGVLRPYRG